MSLVKLRPVISAAALLAFAAGCTDTTVEPSPTSDPTPTPTVTATADPTTSDTTLPGTAAPEPSAPVEEPTPTEEPGLVGPPIDRSVLPESIGEFTLAELELGVTYHRGELLEQVNVNVVAMPADMQVADYVALMENTYEIDGGTCGTQAGVPSCYIETANHGAVAVNSFQPIPDEVELVAERLLPVL